VALGAKTFASWLSFDGAAYGARTWDIVTWGIPVMLGVHRYSLREYSIQSGMQAGSTAAAVALAVAVIIAAGRSLWLTFGGRIHVGRHQRQVATYLVSLAVLNILIYGLNSGIAVGDTPVLRYALFAPLLLVALFGTYFTIDGSRRWQAGAGLALALWAGGAVVDNVRLVRLVRHDPPPSQHRILADYLTARGIHYARAIYWDAYVITFLSQERIIVASTTNVRISSYQNDVERHASEAVTLQRLPCERGAKVAAWCVIGPGDR